MKTRRPYHAPVIYYFDAVYRLGSIREAARSLNIAPSAVSRQIQKLEDDLGIILFERLPSGLLLTAAGESFAQHVRIVIQDSERVYSELDALQGLHRGHVEIMSVEGPTIELLPTVMQRFKQRYPNVSIGVTVAGSVSIADELIAGNADIGIVFDLQRHPDLAQVAMAKFAFGAVVTPNHPLAEKSYVSYEDCLDFALTLSKSDLSIYQKLTDLTFKLHSSHSIINSGSVGLSRQLALKGAGIAFQTKIGIESDIEKGHLCHIPIYHPDALSSELGLYVRAKRSLPVAVDFLMRELSQEIENLAISNGVTDIATL